MAAEDPAPIVAPSTGLVAPAVLGRSVVVLAGDPAPPGWVGSTVVALDEAALAQPAAVIGRLHRAWASRTPVIVALGVDPVRFRHPRPVDDDVWSLDPGVELVEDRLQFLVWANSYDGRSSGPASRSGGRSGPDRPVWWWAIKAARLGGRLPVGEEMGRGDVVLADGRPAWVDGGPRGPLPADLVGAVVVHRESVERGVLTVAASRTPAGVVDLAADQRAAVTHRAGPARIIAPAGSGKTRVLTERLRHLLGGRGWEPDSVLAVAYNKRAAQELEARTVGLSARTRTLNSLGLHLLTSARGRPPAVMDDRETRRLVERLAPVRRRRANTDPIGPYLEALSEIRLGLVDPEQVEARRDDVPGLAQLFDPYRQELAAAGAVDFDEQIYGAVEVLLRDPAFRVAAQLRHRHLLVDEFQDLTPAHVLLVRLLALPALDVFGVGDDDQVIYGHAGADPRFLIDFERLFPVAGDHPLEVNYRCPPAVVTAATALLGYNHRRVVKTIRAGRPEPPAGAPPALDVTLHPGGEGARAVVDSVRSRLDAGRRPADLAVLSRVNALLLAPQVALTEAGVPIRSVLGPEVLERTGLRAALAYLRIATAPPAGIDAHDVVEVLRRPSRGLPPWFSDRVRRRSSWSIDGLAGVAQRVSERDGPKVERLVQDLATVRRAAEKPMSTADLLVLIREGVGLGGAMSLLDASRGGEGSSHLDDLEALEQVAALHPDAADFEGWLRDRFARMTDPDGVTLATVHRVKGMEWDAVVVYGATAGIMPHRLAEDVEEERRVLHVAITRGRERVDVVGDRRRPSPFLAELDGTAPMDHLAGPGRPSERAAGLPARAGSGPAGPAPTSRARHLEARVGITITAAGGYAGTIEAVDGDGAVVAVDGGARLRVRFGETVTIRGRDALLAAPPDRPPEAVRLEDALRSWRRERSRRDKVSAFIVCTDRTLRAVAAARPSSLAALRQIEGIGPTKLEAYGDELLAVVADDEARGSGAPADDEAGGSGAPADDEARGSGAPADDEARGSGAPADDEARGSG